jgi:hypothetical protein
VRMRVRGLGSGVAETIRHPVTARDEHAQRLVDLDEVRAVVDVLLNGVLDDELYGPTFVLGLGKERIAQILGEPQPHSHARTIPTVTPATDYAIVCRKQRRRRCMNTLVTARTWRCRQPGEGDVDPVGEPGSASTVQTCARTVQRPVRRRSAMS